MPHIKLRLLGPPQVELDSVRCDFHSYKALALLAYLAVTQRPHRRATLATLFWPEQRETRSLAYLRHTLWTLRKTLGAALLDSEQEQVRLDPRADLWLDVTTFQAYLTTGDMTAAACATALPRLQAAVALYRDDFLAGFSLRDSAAFDEWHFFEREHLRQQMADALQQVVRGLTYQGDYGAAIPYARRWLALDPLHEPAHQQLLQLYMGSGQRAAAVRQYRECRRILREELAVAPSAETQALYQQLQTGMLAAHQLSTYAPSPLPMHPVAPHPPPHLAASTAAPPVKLSAAHEVHDALRFVTVLAVGLVENAAPSLATAEDFLTPDQHAEAITSLWQLVEERATADGAQIERILGGVILALFGVQSTHEGDAEQAVHTALAIQRAARQQALPVSLGLSCGLVYVGAQTVTATPKLVLGTVVTLATQLQARGEGGACLVSTPVYRQTRGVFRFHARTLQRVGTDSPLTAYQVVGKTTQPRKMRGIEGLRAPLVGRQRELATLQELANQAQHGQGQLVAISGEAGVGKSRLIEELRGQLPSHAPQWLWLEGRCLELAQGAGYAPFLTMLQDYWGWRTEESEATRVGSITTLLAELREDGHLPATQVDEVGAVLGRLWGLQFGNVWDRLLAQVDGHALQQRTATALAGLLMALAHRQPLILVLEDLHWADTLSLELTNLLMTKVADSPVLLLCLYRPEAQRRAWQLPVLATQRCPGQFTHLLLHALTPAQSRLLIDTLLAVDQAAAPPAASLSQDATANLSPALQQLILSKGQGNPLYMEELIYALIASGLLTRQPTGWSSAPQLTLSTVPESLQSIIYTRLDLIGAPWKQILQCAAVIGRTVRRRLWSALMPPEWDLEEAIGRLIEAAFLYQERLYPEEEYSFRHVLVQEAIYQGLVQRQRRQLHRQVAECLEELAGTRLHDQVDLLAYHWSRAGEPAQAIQYLVLAGDKAQAALAYHEAAEYYRRAVGFLRQQHDLAVMARTLLKLGNSYHSMGDFRHARQAYNDAFALQQQVTTAEDSDLSATHTLRLAWGEPLSLDPIFTGNTSEVAVVQQLFSPLILISPAFEILPAVAQRWEILQGGRRYIFHLRPDVQWSDGAPVTAHDYALTLQRILAPTAPDNMASLFFAIKQGQAYHTGAVVDRTRLGLAVPDEHTLVIDLEQPASYFLQSLTCAAAYPTPAHLFARHGEACLRPEVVVANGPFQVLTWQRGHTLTLTRNPRFFGQPRGNVGRVELLFHLPGSEQVARYERDQLDLLWLNDQDATAREPLRQRHPEEYQTAPLLNVLFAAFDATQSPFTDRRVRQAFVHAIDREVLVNTALGGYEQPAHGGFIPVGLPGHSPDIGLGFDPTLARRLLQEAGYGDSAQFPALTALAWRGTETVCEALRAQWCRQLGIALTWRLLDYPDFLRCRYTERPALFLFGWTCDYPDASIVLDLFANTDITRWSNPEFQQCFAEAQRTLEPAQRLALLAQADQIAIADAAVLPLYYERLQFLRKPRIRRYPLAPFRWWFWQDVIIED